MTYKYANHKAWIKRGRSSFISAVFVIIWLVVDTVLQGEVHPLILTITLITFLVALVRGMQYFNMSERDYIRIENDFLFIDRGMPFLPYKQLPVSSIERYTEYYPLLVFQLKRDHEIQINIDWLTDEAVADIKQYLDKRLDSKQTKV